MHSFSAAAADTSLCHLHSSDLAVSPSLPFSSFPNFVTSHSSLSSSSSSLLAYSQLLGSELDPMLESSGFLHSEVSYSGSSGPCSSYESPATSQPGLIQRSASSHSLLRNNGQRHRLGVRVSASLFDAEGPMRRVYSSGDLLVSFFSLKFTRK